MTYPIIFHTNRFNLLPQTPSIRFNKSQKKLLENSLMNSKIMSLIKFHLFSSTSSYFFPIIFASNGKIGKDFDIV
jgi:hypothetical protein